MSIEDEVFRRYHFEPMRGEAYGFLRQGETWRYEQTFLSGAFRAVLTVAAGQVTGRVIDTMTEEEYLPLRQNTTAGQAFFVFLATCS